MEAVAIDGPVGSGKSTVGRLVAGRLDFAFLDTGLMYRAVTWSTIRTGIELTSGQELARATQCLRIELARLDGMDRLLVDGVDVTDELRTPEVDRSVSAVSAVPGVRRALVPQQRSMADHGSIVMVGRDIGTVVLTDARTKAYLDASVEVRAGRRRAELVRAGQAADLDQVIRETRCRDRIDSERSDSPLRMADDALLIRTDDLTVDQVVTRIVNLVRDG